jgi:hypothetical protein
LFLSYEFQRHNNFAENNSFKFCGKKNITEKNKNMIIQGILSTYLFPFFTNDQLLLSSSSKYYSPLLPLCPAYIFSFLFQSPCNVTTINNRGNDNNNNEANNKNIEISLNNINNDNSNDNDNNNNKNNNFNKNINLNINNNNNIIININKNIKINININNNTSESIELKEKNENLINDVINLSGICLPFNFPIPAHSPPTTSHPSSPTTLYGTSKKSYNTSRKLTEKLLSPSSNWFVIFIFLFGDFFIIFFIISFHKIHHSEVQHILYLLLFFTKFLLIPDLYFILQILLFVFLLHLLGNGEVMIWFFIFCFQMFIELFYLASIKKCFCRCEYSRILE